MRENLLAHEFVGSTTVRRKVGQLVLFSPATLDRTFPPLLFCSCSQRQMMMITRDNSRAISNSVILLIVIARGASR